MDDLWSRQELCHTPKLRKEISVFVDRVHGTCPFSLRTMIVAFFVCALGVNVYAKDTAGFKQTKLPTQFIIISLATEDDDAIKKVASTFKTSNQGIAVGVGTIISYLATEPEETVRKLKHFLSTAEQYER